jgi:hypothetical protein
LVKNVGSADRAVRMTAGVLMLFNGLVLLGGSGGSAIGLGIAALGALALITGATRHSLLYARFGTNTYKLTQTSRRLT